MGARQAVQARGWAAPASVQSGGGLTVAPGREPSSPRPEGGAEPERTRLYVRIGDDRERRDATAIGPALAGGAPAGHLQAGERPGERRQGARVVNLFLGLALKPALRALARP